MNDIEYNVGVPIIRDLDRWRSSAERADASYRVRRGATAQGEQRTCRDTANAYRARRGKGCEPHRNLHCVVVVFLVPTRTGRPSSEPLARSPTSFSSCTPLGDWR